MMSAKIMSPSLHADEQPGAAGAISRLRAIGFLLVCLSPFLIAWRLMQMVSALALGNDTYTHIPLIPLVSLFLIYTNRKTVFSQTDLPWKLGGALITVGLLAITSARLNVFQLQSANQLSLAVSGVVLVWIGSFGLFFGFPAFRAARFALCFLFFMIPIPEPILAKTIYALQVGSAQSAAALFSLFGIPYLQNGLVFSLPGIAIRVAEECSGIRSTLALLIMTVLASHMFLKATWKQLLVCLLAVPLSVAKNGLRIATLSALAVYVDPGFLYGRLHQSGGMFFFAAAFVPLALIFVWLRKIGSGNSGAV